MASSDLLPETQALISSPHEGLFSSLTSLRSQPASYIQFRAWRSTAHSNPSLWRDLDRVQVLGDEDQGGYGHTGCVNALSWSQDGETLISSGDDCRLCVWRPPTSFSSTSSTDQFTCSVTLQTGHTGNVFAAHFLPHTSDAHVATCAADKQVRVFDVTRTTGGTSRPMHVRSSEAGGMRERSWEERTEGMCCLRVLRCHTKRTKRIVTEDSPNFFLTVSEDHTVRQHDLRTYHQCGSGGNCPAPMIKLPYSLSTIACSPITPWNFVVAGDSTFGHLFDRRMIGRILRHEWGQSILGEDQDENSTRCVRRFGRFKRGPKERKIHSHITAARMARTNGHELLLSYSGDAVYLYNIKDSPFEPAPQASSILLPNRSPPLSQSSSSKKPASPVSSPSTRKRKKVDIDRPVSPTWAFASATSQSGAGSGLETQPEAVDEEADHTPTEWQGIDEGSPRESIHHVDEIVTVDVDSLSNFARTGGLERLEVGTGGSDGAEVIGAEEAEVDSDEDEDEDEMRMRMGQKATKVVTMTTISFLQRKRKKNRNWVMCKS
ncbi:hypothetical protein FRB94_000542 [Tulasnella sp. JGI-2019a]|nr:hypothetical protein FRB94_000542 [Tulasnella sp. JGI-2019a]